MAVTALVVIDMQTGFLASLQEFQKNRTTQIIATTSYLVKKAARDNIPLVVIETNKPNLRMGKTHKFIRREIQDHPNYKIVTKTKNDGSSLVREACYQHLKIEPTRFVICGVFLGACVFSTAKGIFRWKPDAELIIIQNACDKDLWAVEKYKNQLQNVNFMTVAQPPTL